MNIKYQTLPENYDKVLENKISGYCISLDKNNGHLRNAFSMCLESIMINCLNLNFNIVQSSRQLHCNMSTYLQHLRHNICSLNIR